MHFARIEMSIKPNIHVVISGTNRKDLDENIEEHLEEVYLGTGRDPQMLERNDDMPKLDFLELTLDADIFYFQSPGIASTEVQGPEDGELLQTKLMPFNRSRLIPATIRSNVVSQEAIDRVHELMADESFSLDYFYDELTASDMLQFPSVIEALKIGLRNVLLARAVDQACDEGLIDTEDEHQALEDFGHNLPFSPYGSGYTSFMYNLGTYTPNDDPRGNLESYAPDLIQRIEDKLNQNLTDAGANWTPHDANLMLRVGLFTMWAELESMNINGTLPHGSGLLSSIRSTVMFAIMIDTLTAGYS